MVKMKLSHHAITPFLPLHIYSNQEQQLLHHPFSSSVFSREKDLQHYAIKHLEILLTVEKIKFILHPLT